MSLNRYAYTSNNPVMNIDPSGHKLVSHGEEYGSSSSYSSSSSQTTTSNTQILITRDSDDKSNVSKIQTMLGFLDYYLGPTGADGDFGDFTYDAVVAFQKDYNLKPDGKVGAKTFSKLNEVYNAAAGMGLSPEKMTIPKNNTASSGTSSNYANSKIADTRVYNDVGCGFAGEISSGNQGTDNTDTRNANNSIISKASDFGKTVVESVKKTNAEIRNTIVLTTIVTGIVLVGMEAEAKASTLFRNAKTGISGGGSEAVLTTEEAEGYAFNAIKGPKKADSVMLGKFEKNSLSSYDEMAKEHGSQYFNLDNWDELSKTYSRDEIWKINKRFLDIETSSGREIYLSHNPAKYIGDGSYYSDELQYLIDNGYTFKKEGDVWHATR